MEDDGGSYGARLLSHCPPLPIWAGKERKLPTSSGLLCLWFGGGEKRTAGPFPALFGGLGKEWKEGRRRRDWAISGLSTRRVELGHGSSVAFYFSFPHMH